MTRAALPGRDQVLTTLSRLRSETGRPPTVLSLARRLGLANTTFRRNFPDVVLELSRQTAASQCDSPQASAYQQLQRASNELRRGNHELREQLALATAVIQRLTLENHQLRQQIEASTRITRIGPRPAQPAPASHADRRDPAGQAGAGTDAECRSTDAGPEPPGEGSLPRESPAPART